MDEKLKRHGAFGWCELMTDDVEAAKAFYQQVFGWQIEPLQMKNFIYNQILIEGEPIGGIMPLPDGCEAIPSRWYHYVSVFDIDAAIAKIEKLGGKLLRAATCIPEVGYFCVMEDPQGAILCAIQYIPQPCPSPKADNSEL